MKIGIKAVKFEITDENNKKLGELSKRDKDNFDISLKVGVSSGDMTSIGTKIDYLIDNADKDLYTILLKAERKTETKK